MKKWSGVCSNIEELCSGIKNQFELEEEFDLQYLDRDVSEYIDLENYVFEDFKAQQYKLVRLIFPAREKSKESVGLEASILFSELHRVKRNSVAIKPNTTRLALIQLDQAGVPKSNTNKVENAQLPPRSARSCRKKPISYAELSSSSPIPNTKAVACERTLFHRPHRI